ncbi:hypothetical protein IJE86_03455 [bacterium]|nr:hypothetical protein [bacterium]
MRTNIENIKAFLIETLNRKSSISLYANYFSRMEENFAKYNLLDELGAFICDYLTIYSNGKVLKDEDIYSYFRDFYMYAARMKTDENILKHIYRYSNYYLKLLTLEISDVDVKNLISKINKIGAVDTYPYLLEVFEDYEFAHINKNTFLDILETVVEYAANRKFSEKEYVPFSVLSNELNKMLAMKNYVPQVSTNPIAPKFGKITINDLLNQY